MANIEDAGIERAAKRKRRQRLAQVALALGLLVVGASMDASLISPRWPLARQPEQVGATFVRCHAGVASYACVVDGNSIHLGQRKVRLTGIDAPEIGDAKCAAERQLGERAANRLVTLLNQGRFELVEHRFDTGDRFGRELRVARRGGIDLGRQLIGEGLAHRYLGFKRGWC